MTKTAATTVPVHPLLAERWSTRSFESNHELADDQLTAMLEAARWAPSANNSQPWRFLVAHRNSSDFATLHRLLAPGNQAWAGSASALILVAAETVDASGRKRPWALYDTGAAVAVLSTQAEAEDLAVHQMGGFDASAVNESFALPLSLTPVVVLAVGQRATRADALPEPFAQRELAPRVREPLENLLLAAPSTAGSDAEQNRRAA